MNIVILKGALAMLQFEKISADEAVGDWLMVMRRFKGCEDELRVILAERGDMEGIERLNALRRRMVDAIERARVHGPASLFKGDDLNEMPCLQELKKNSLCWYDHLPPEKRPQFDPYKELNLLWHMASYHLAYAELFGRPFPRFTA